MSSTPSRRQYMQPDRYTIALVESIKHCAWITLKLFTAVIYDDKAQIRNMPLIIQNELKKFNDYTGHSYKIKYDSDAIDISLQLADTLSKMMDITIRSMDDLVTQWINKSKDIIKTYPTKQKALYDTLKIARDDVCDISDRLEFINKAIVSMKEIITNFNTTKNKHIAEQSIYKSKEIIILTCSCVIQGIQYTVKNIGDLEKILVIESNEENLLGKKLLS